MLKKVTAFMLTAVLSACFLSTTAVADEIENENEKPLCEHSLYGEIVEEEIPATCTENGKTQVIYCENCHEILQGGEEIPKLEHTYGEEIVVLPTYEQEGYTHRFCEICGYEDIYDNVEKLTVADVTDLKTTANATKSISLSWSKATDVTGYVIYQKKNGNWSKISSTNNLSTKISKLSTGTKYDFAVKAYKVVDKKTYYSPNFTSISTATTPLNPATISASTTANSLTLAWNKVANCSGYGIFVYKNGKWENVTTTTSTNYTVKNLKQATNYVYCVKAYTEAGGVKYYGAYKSVSTCTKPQNVSFTLTAKAESVAVSWTKLSGVTGYKVYYRENGKTSWTLAKTTTGSSYTLSKLTAGKKYDVTVKAYKVYNGITYLGNVTTKTVTPQYAYKLYTVNKYATTYTKAKKYYGNVSKGAMFTGYYCYKYPGYIVLNYKNTEILVKSSYVTARNSAVVLPTASIGQYGGKIAGYSSCGPTSVAILLNSEKNAGWDKDNLITYSEKHKLNDQGSLRKGGGMTAPKLLELISGYSNKKYTAKNIYSTKTASSTLLKIRLTQVTGRL